MAQAMMMAAPVLVITSSMPFDGSNTYRVQHVIP
jgi:hypothetical protein